MLRNKRKVKTVWQMGLFGATLVAMFSVLLVVVAASVLESISTKGDGAKRTMGALSVCQRDLRKRDDSWKDAFLETDADERRKLDPVKAFVYADVVENDGGNRIDYGVAVGYTPSFLTEPVKQVSYVLFSEELSKEEPASDNKKKIAQRQHMLYSMHQSLSELVSNKSGFSNVELSTPCVMPESYKYFLD